MIAILIQIQTPIAGSHHDGHPGTIRVTKGPVNESDLPDHAAADELMPVVYKELRRLAQKHLRPKGPNPSLQATALVHGAYLRMVDKNVHLESRAQFYGFASKLMRNIFVDPARHKNAEKHGRSIFPTAPKEFYGTASES